MTSVCSKIRVTLIFNVVTFDAEPIGAMNIHPPSSVIVSARLRPMVKLARWLFQRHRHAFDE